MTEHGISSEHLKVHIEHFGLENDPEIADYKKELVESEMKK